RTPEVTAQSSLRRLRIRLTYSRTADQWASADPPGTTLPNSDLIDGASRRVSYARRAEERTLGLRHFCRFRAQSQQGSEPAEGGTARQRRTAEVCRDPSPEGIPVDRARHPEREW